MEESLMEAFEPPEAGDAPAGVKAILKKVYNGCRATWVKDHPGDGENPESKERCSKIAWGAVKQAGWKRADDGWRKEHVNMEDFFVTLGDAARVRLEGRRGRQRELADEVLAAYRRLLVEGGSGSGYFDHPGRPGEVGGSLPEGGGSGDRGGSADKSNGGSKGSPSGGSSQGDKIKSTKGSIPIDNFRKTTNHILKISGGNLSSSNYDGNNAYSDLAQKSIFTSKAGAQKLMKHLDKSDFEKSPGYRYEKDKQTVVGSIYKKGDTKIFVNMNPNTVGGKPIITITGPQQAKRTTVPYYD